MILPFSNKFPNGEFSFFAEKINKSFQQKICTKYKHFTYEYCFRYNLDYQIMVYDPIPAKIHTIREDLKNRWKQGNKIHAVYNNRSKNQFQFAPVFQCSGIQEIKIEYPNKNSFPFVWIDKIPIGSQKLKELALNDGFLNIEHFFNWFNKDFQGKIIHWTDFRY